MIRRYLGIDYGRARVGLAMSDPLGMMAHPYKTLRHRGKTPEMIADEIAEICKANAITDIVLGLPARTDGKLGEMAEAVKAFAVLLEDKTALKATLYDERFTSVIAMQMMNEAEVRGSRKKGLIDQIAAEILLTDFLKYQERSENK